MTHSGWQTVDTEDALGRTSLIFTHRQHGRLSRYIDCIHDDFCGHDIPGPAEGALRQKLGAEMFELTLLWSM